MVFLSTSEIRNDPRLVLREEEKKLEEDGSKPKGGFPFLTIFNGTNERVFSAEEMVSSRFSVKNGFSSCLLAQPDSLMLLIQWGVVFAGRMEEE